MKRAWLAILVIALPACGPRPEQPAPPAGSATSSTDGDGRVGAGGHGAAAARLHLAGENPSPALDALRFMPASTTSAFIRQQRAIHDFGVPFLIEPGSRATFAPEAPFAFQEIEVAATYLQSSQHAFGADAYQVGYLRFAPRSTNRRLINASQLQPDEQRYPGLISYRANDERSGYVLFAEGDQTAIVGNEALLKPRLEGSEGPGPLERRIRPLVSDHELVFGCLTDYEGLGLVSPYLKPFDIVLEIFQEDFRRLPAGTFSAIVIALRIGDQPELRIQFEGADSTLAAEVEGIIRRGVERLQQFYQAVRGDLIQQLAMDAGHGIDSFLTATLTGIGVSRDGVLIDIALPLGADAEAFKRFANRFSSNDIELVRRIEEAVDRARRRGRLRDPVERLKMIGLAFHNHHDVYGYMPTAIRGADGKPLLSWRVALLPFIEPLEKEELYNEFRLDESWDSPHNLRLLDRIPDIYRDERLSDPVKTTIVMFDGKGTPLSEQELTFSRVLDGASRSLLCIQATPQVAVPWTKPEDVPFRPEDPIAALGPLPDDGIPVLMFDGRALRLPKTLEAEIWRRLIQHSDGSAVNLP